MNRDRFRKIEEIYHAALEVASGARAAFLEDKCGSDLEIKKEVKTLLQFEKSPASFLEDSPADVAAMMFADRENADDLVNSTLGRYRIDKVLGEGGMGTVYLAYDTRLARHVALKILPAGMVSNNDRVQRFMHEARAASALNHPHILTVYEIDEIVGENGETIHFISMEYIDGKTLNQLIYKEKTPTNELLTYLSQVASGLAKAHAAGIIHRDLKPENIMVSADGYAKILDFGLAKLSDTEHELSELQRHRSRPGVILGTLGYMSPEQALGKTDIDARSDIFAFGCILYEALARRKAFEAETTIDALHMIIHGEPRLLKSIDPNIADDLCEIVEKCLSKERKGRFREASRIAGLIKGASVEGAFDRTLHFPVSGQLTTSIHGKETGKGHSRSISGQRRQVTVVLIDASAISEMFEDFDPERSSVIMGDLWDFLRGLILRGGGKIGERLADTILSVWGTESTRESDPESAVRTALDLQKEASVYFDRRLSGEISLSPEEKDRLKKARFLKIGISTGTVLVGISRSTGEFMTSGSAVNVAKRLISATNAGEVLVSHETYRHIRGVFQVEEVTPSSKPLSLRYAKASKVYSIKAVKPRVFRSETRGVEGVETLMVGRDAELTKMLSALDAAKEDRELHVVTVLGEAGLGKSRLLYEFYDRVDLLPDRFFVFKARALESMQGQPFSLLREIFLFRFDIQEKDSLVVAREKFVQGILEMTSDITGRFGNGSDREMKAHFIGQLIGLDFSGSRHISGLVESEKQVQDRAVLYASQFFSSVSQKHPSVFYLDDLHWADDESLNFLDTISLECKKSPILICGFARLTLFERRPHWGEGRENWSRIRLLPLTKRETGSLIADILEKAGGIPPQLKELLVAKTAGNPFYVEELVKMLIEEGVIDTSDEKWTIDPEKVDNIHIPQTLTGVLQSRLDRLSEAERRVLQRASVVGREFWNTTLEDLGDGVDLPAALEALRKKELIFQKETSALNDSAEFAFKHALLCDVTYETILLEERQNWHLQTAESLVRTKVERRNEYLAVIAEHFEKGGEVERSAEWFGRAAEAARRNYALDAAANYYGKALGAWDAVSLGDAKVVLTSEQAMKWQHGLARVLDLQARFPEAVAAFNKVLEMANIQESRIGQAYAYWGLSITQFELGETRRSLKSAIEIVRLAGDKDLVSSKDANFLLAAGFYRQARAMMALAHFEEAISLIESSSKMLSERGAITPAARVNILHLLAGANMYLGRIKEAQEFEKEEVEIAFEIGDLKTAGNGLNSLGFQSYLKGDPSEAINYYGEALQISLDIGNKAGEIMILSNIYGAKVLLGEYAYCEEQLKSLIGDVGEKGHFLVSEMYRFLAESLVGQGKYEEALEKARRSLSLSQETDNQEAIGEAWRLLGVAASCLGEKILVSTEELSADECFQKSLEINERLGMEANYALAIRNLEHHKRSLGDHEKADELLAIESEISNRLEIDTAAKCPYFTG